MKKIFWPLLFLIMAITGCQNNPKFQKIKVADQPLKVQVVTQLSEMTKGLGVRDSLPEDEGMLFVYSNYQQPNFWMKDMRFPLDIIWIKDNLIVDITENIPIPTTTPLPHYQPKESVNYVLEVNAGWVEKNKIKVGDKVQFNP